MSVHLTGGSAIAFLLGNVWTSSDCNRSAPEVKASSGFIQIKRYNDPPHLLGGSDAAVSGHTTPSSSPAVSSVPETSLLAHTSQTAGSRSSRSHGSALSQTQTSASAPQTHAPLSTAPSPSCGSSRAPLHPPDPYNGSAGR